MTKAKSWTKSWKGKLPVVNMKPMKDRQNRQGKSIADLRIRVIALEAMVSRLVSAAEENQDEEG